MWICEVCKGEYQNIVDFEKHEKAAGHTNVK